MRIPFPPLAAAAALLPAAPSCADTIHWQWQVEVNGSWTDSTRPVRVEAGDVVSVNLWASMSPAQEALAAATFAISFGDDLLNLGSLNLDPADGQGLTPAFAGLGESGSLTDSTGDGTHDMIDSVTAWQLARFFGEPTYDPANPVRVYAMRWAVAGTPTRPIAMNHQPTLAGLYESRVYTDAFGTSRLYDNTADQLVFIPSPPTIAGCLLPIALRRRTSRGVVHG